MTIQEATEGGWHRNPRGKGNIPRSVENLTMLEMLDLSDNNLEGNTPQTIGYLTNLKIIYLGANKLSGEIPRNIGKLTKLHALDLSANNIEGHIPQGIGQVAMLQDLRLFKNNLQGNIPRSVENMTMLETLGLSHNNLEGFTGISSAEDPNSKKYWEELTVNFCLKIGLTCKELGENYIEFRDQYLEFLASSSLANTIVDNSAIFDSMADQLHANEHEIPARRSIREMVAPTDTFRPSGEDPNRHVQILERVCSTMKPPTANLENLMLKCPYLNVGKKFLIDYFHVGLQIHDRETIDAAANSSLLDLPLDDAWALLEKLDIYSQLDFFKMSISNPLQAQIASMSNALVVSICGICNSTMHVTSNCMHAQDVGAMYQQQRPYNYQHNQGAMNNFEANYRSTYNPSWRQHPNFSYKGNQEIVQAKNSQVIPIQDGGVDKQMYSYLERIVDAMFSMGQKFDSYVSRAELKMDILLKRMDNLESKQQSTNLVVQQFGNSNSISQAQGSGNLPTQPVINLKSLSAIELRSGRILESIPSASNHGGSKPNEVISRNSQICKGSPLSLDSPRDSTCCDSKINVHPSASHSLKNMPPTSLSPQVIDGKDDSIKEIVVEDENGARSALHAQAKEAKLSSNQG
ncbi:uncharacterized protein LOC129314011 [Prosopis cineraria]|uniref:uncharacterized protein LOC129314011 n=1 Tax=Prosopis cineraria TaxID=364024 RepID=UPI00240FC87E|nr:uncharacterized protein LOC129314011 [Prosopis cineraria]